MEKFESIKGFKNTGYWIKECSEKSEEAKRKEKKLRNMAMTFVKGAVIFSLLVMLVVKIKKNIKINIGVSSVSTVETQPTNEDDENTAEIQQAVEINENTKKGDIVILGKYEQDGDPSTLEDIEWIVLHVDEEKGEALLISKYALEAKPFNEDRSTNLWSKCDLRDWLNGEEEGQFYHDAFSEDKNKDKIIKSTVEAQINEKYPNLPVGEDTEDWVFLLNLQEAVNNDYFANDEERRCKPTQHAINNGVGVNSRYGICMWWLWSPGYESYYVAFINAGGTLSFLGGPVSFSNGAVRPSLRVNLKS